MSFPTRRNIDRDRVRPSKGQQHEFESSSTDHLQLKCDIKNLISAKKISHFTSIQVLSKKGEKSYIN